MTRITEKEILKEYRLIPSILIHLFWILFVIVMCVLSVYLLIIGIRIGLAYEGFLMLFTCIAFLVGEIIIIKQIIDDVINIKKGRYIVDKVKVESIIHEKYKAFITVENSDRKLYVGEHQLKNIIIGENYYIVMLYNTEETVLFFSTEDYKL